MSKSSPPELPHQTDQHRIALFSQSGNGPDQRDTLADMLPHCDIVLTPELSPLLHELKLGHFQVLLIDISAGVDNPVKELLDQIKPHVLPGQLPIIVLSRPESNTDLKLAIDLGANDFLYLPLQRHKTTVRLNNALAYSQCFKSHLAIQNSLQLASDTRKTKLDMLINTGLMMAMEKSRERLLDYILHEGQKLLNCDGATLYLVTKNNTLRYELRTRADVLPFDEISLLDSHGRQNNCYTATFAANNNQTVSINDVYRERYFDCSGARSLDAQTGYQTISLLTVPLAPRNGHVIGVLQFINAMDASGEIIPFRADMIELVEALAAQAAVALDNLKLIDGQKAATESIIRVIAAAIDTKSPHTGHHCVRVPELAIMLAEAACNQTEGPLAKFNFNSSDEWLEFKVGAWLHDCGKVTTPEYVIEKATKLDMLYNRIHEIRMRFEVLLRDAEITRLHSLLQGEDKTIADQRYAATKAELQADFAFIADCNMGQENMHSEDCDRIRAIAQKTWWRHFDDELGLSQLDTMQLQSQAKPTLPVQEQLLADKPKQVIPRPCDQFPDPALGIQMVAPKDLFNYGEIYNLTIRKGTLTAEDRYKINEHIIQTINLLEKVPFPDFLKRVPEYASTHHETLDGRGYPRKLTAKQLSIPARIMAIADIFEAITASDRPYKKPYTLSQAINILHTMKKNRHIDPDIFELFLSSGVYLQFAEKYLLPEQIDTVNVSHFIDSAHPVS